MAHGIPNREPLRMTGAVPQVRAQPAWDRQLHRSQALTAAAALPGPGLKGRSGLKQPQAQQQQQQQQQQEGTT